MKNFDEIKNPNQLLEFMNNITYGFIGKNGKKYTDMQSQEWNDWHEQCFVQNGEEVLKSKIGTCWDQVELERLWFEKNNYKFKTIYMWFEVNRENDLPTHTFLIYEDNNKWYWFEHAFEMYKGIHEFNSEEEAIKYVKEKQCEYASHNNSGFKDRDEYTLECYEYNKPPDNLGVDEYTNYVTSGNKIKFEKNIDESRPYLYFWVSFIFPIAGLILIIFFINRNKKILKRLIIGTILGSLILIYLAVEQINYNKALEARRITFASELQSLFSTAETQFISDSMGNMTDYQNGISYGEVNGNTVVGKGFKILDHQGRKIDYCINISLDGQVNYFYAKDEKYQYVYAGEGLKKENITELRLNKYSDEDLTFYKNGIIYIDGSEDINNSYARVINIEDAMKYCKPYNEKGKCKFQKLGINAETCEIYVD